ncbi:MAG: hypothetical protein AAGG81_00250 [Chlamydiota bacterium]
MNKTLRTLGLYFAAGCLGGVAMNLVNIFLNLVNIPLAIGVDLTADYSLTALYSDLFWGGIWGFLFIIPFLKDLYLLKGVILSLIPTFTQLVIVLPFFKGASILGLEFGTMMPVYVMMLNIIWGLVAGLFLLKASEN